jgi:hypothetical protein
MILNQMHHKTDPRSFYRVKASGAAASYGQAFLIAIVLGLLLPAGCFLGGMQELGVSICSIEVVSLFVFWMVRRCHLTVGLLLISFLVGYLLSWCVGFLGYCYILPWRGFDSDIFGRHFMMTSILVLLACGSTCLGGWTAIKLTKPVRNRLIFEGFSTHQLRPQWAAFGVVFFIYQILFFSILGFNARWEIGNSLAVGSNAYWVAGFRSPMIAFYALLGCSLKPPLRSTSNLIVGGIILVCTCLNSLSGGREVALEPFVACLMGALFSPIGWRLLAKIFMLALPLFVALLIVLGWSRNEASGFAGGSVADKIAAFSQTAHKGSIDISAENDPAFQFFSRLFESSGQIVIDDDIESNARVGWLNFDRLPFLFVPQFMYPAKIPVQDGTERLIMDHGFRDDSFSSSPFTFLADTYERFGIKGVIGFHFAAGMILLFMGRLVLATRWQLLGVLLLVCFAKAALRLYPLSVLEFINAIFYGFLRDTVVIACIFVVGRYLQGTMPAKVGLASSPTHPFAQGS